MKIQSYVDLITNSSTSVFTWADNIEGVKEIINSVLKASGSNLTCDDLFDITISYDAELGDTNNYYLDTARDIVKEDNNEELANLLALYDSLLADSSNKINWSKVEEVHKNIYDILVNDYGEQTLDSWAENYNEDSWDYKYSSGYIIKAKKPEYQEYADKISTELGELFSYDAVYC